MPLGSIRYLRRRVTSELSGIKNNSGSSLAFATISSVWYVLALHGDSHLAIMSASISSGIIFF